MKKLLLLLLFIPLVSFGQDTIPAIPLQPLIKTDSLTKVKTKIPSEYTPKFKLYKTDNMYTFLKLDTATGEITQIQYSVGESLQGEVSLQWRNLTLDALSFEELGKLDYDDNPFPNNRYILKPTENMYNFILLDQTDGRMWQIQWSMEAENRGIVHEYPKQY